MKKATTNVQLIDWQKQASEEAVKWAKLSVNDPVRLTAFEAGHAQGWRDCISTLKLHGLLETKE